MAIIHKAPSGFRPVSAEPGALSAEADVTIPGSCKAGDVVSSEALEGLAKGHYITGGKKMIK